MVWDMALCHWRLLGLGVLVVLWTAVDEESWILLSLPVMRAITACEVAQCATWRIVPLPVSLEGCVPGQLMSITAGDPM
jgi:hypothetical protein